MINYLDRWNTLINLTLAQKLAVYFKQQIATTRLLGYQIKLVQLYPSRLSVCILALSKLYHTTALLSQIVKQNTTIRANMHVC